MRTTGPSLSLLVLSAALLLSVCLPTSEAKMRVLPFRKRDGDGKSVEGQLPTGYETKLAYVAPTFDEVKGIYAKETTIADVITGYRSSFTEACATHLNESSVNFSNHVTFGWFTFRRDSKKSDAVNDGVLVFKVACYECSNYDVDGSDPGTAINEATGDVIDGLKWKKEDAATQGKDLIVQFETYLKSQNATATATPTSTSTSTSTSSTTTDSSKEKDGEANDEKTKVSTSTGSDADDDAKAGSKHTPSTTKDSKASTAVGDSTTAQNVTTSTTKDQSS